MRFGQFGREENSLILIGQSGSLSIKILKRGVVFDPKEAIPGKECIMYMYMYLHEHVIHLRTCTQHTCIASYMYIYIHLRMYIFNVADIHPLRPVIVQPRCMYMYNVYMYVLLCYVSNRSSIITIG